MLLSRFILLAFGDNDTMTTMHVCFMISCQFISHTVHCKSSGFYYHFCSLFSSFSTDVVRRCDCRFSLGTNTFLYRFTPNRIVEQKNYLPCASFDKPKIRENSCFVFPFLFLPFSPFVGILQIFFHWFANVQRYFKGASNNSLRIHVVIDTSNRKKWTSEKGEWAHNDSIFHLKWSVGNRVNGVSIRLSKCDNTHASIFWEFDLICIDGESI